MMIIYWVTKWNEMTRRKQVFGNWISYSLLLRLYQIRPTLGSDDKLAGCHKHWTTATSFHHNRPPSIHQEADNYNWRIISLHFSFFLSFLEAQISLYSSPFSSLSICHYDGWNHSSSIMRYLPASHGTYHQLCLSIFEFDCLCTTKRMKGEGDKVDTGWLTGPNQIGTDIWHSTRPRRRNHQKIWYRLYLAQKANICPIN